MPVWSQGETRLYYEEFGDPDGVPLLLLAPGGMRSASERWGAVDWDPRKHFGDRRVIAMDQRNAGRSEGPIEADHGWERYTQDQLGLLDHLGVERVQVLGMCIGGPYGLRLARAAPERVRGLVLFQPIGLADNREAFFALFDSWVRAIRAKHPEADTVRWRAFRDRMFGGDFLFGLDRAEAAQCACPVLLFQGDDLYHPASISRELARLLPDVELVERWKPPECTPEVVERVRDFLVRSS